VVLESLKLKVCILYLVLKSQLTLHDADSLTKLMYLTS
jgi:hypothetical protein